MRLPQFVYFIPVLLYSGKLVTRNERESLVFGDVATGPMDLPWSGLPGWQWRWLATLCCLFILPSLMIPVTAISFHLPPNVRKCLREEVQKDDVVKGEFELSVAPQEIKTDLHILDSKGHKLYAKEDAQKGKFAFSVEEYEMIEICFETKFDTPYGRPPPPPREISFLIRHGVEAKNYDDIAKAEKLKPMEAELRRLEDLSDAIVESFNHMRKREDEMRGTNEQTSSRVLYFSVFSMLCLLALTTWQVLYLRRFFKAKKLIE